MNFDDQKNMAARHPARLPQPKPGDRICKACQPPVTLVVDMSRPRYEFRCPKCGGFEEWFGLTMKETP